MLLQINIAEAAVCNIVNCYHERGKMCIRDTHYPLLSKRMRGALRASIVPMVPVRGESEQPEPGPGLV